jgi:hypothetical protein
VYRIPPECGYADRDARGAHTIRVCHGVCIHAVDGEGEGEALQHYLTGFVRRIGFADDNYNLAVSVDFHLRDLQPSRSGVLFVV